MTMDKLKYVAATCFLLAAVCMAQSGMTNEEKAMEKLERESLTHNSPTEAAIAWWKPHLADHGVFIDPLGHVYSFSKEEYEPTMTAMAKADPNVKNSVAVESVSVHISGDTAYLTVNETASSTGHKDKRFDYHGKYQLLDVWQKRDGEWKNLATAIVSTEAIPAESYKLPVMPGTESISKDK
jgi:ketosteroid isomerase-like protein